jgi:hypothetical protein
MSDSFIPGKMQKNDIKFRPHPNPQIRRNPQPARPSGAVFNHQRPRHIRARRTVPVAGGGGEVVWVNLTNN